MFKRFKSLVEKEAGSLMGCLRIDRGSEFTSKQFNEYCSMNGIKRQLIAAYTPQQNKVAERKNQTIMNLVRNMLSETYIPRKLQLEAVNWCVHVLNRSPTLAIKDPHLKKHRVVLNPQGNTSECLVALATYIFRM